MKEKIALRSFLLLMSKTVPLVIQMVIIFVYARSLSFEEYGKYQSLWLFVNVLSVIGLFGLPTLLLSNSLTGIRIWIQQYKSRFALLFILLNILPPLYFLFFTKNYNFNSAILLIALVFIQNIAIISEMISIKNEREKLVLFTNIIFSAGFLVWHLGVLYYGYSLTKILTGLIFLQMIKSAILFPYKQNTQRTITTDHPYHHTGHQWFYLGITDIIGMLFKWLDKWVILLLLTATQFAIYFNGSYEIPVFGLLLSAMGNIILVELSKKREKFSEDFCTINIQSTLILNSVVLPSFSFLLVYHYEFFTLLFSSKYEASIPFFLISILILPARGTYSTAALQVLNRSDLILKGAILDILLAVIFMFILYPILQAKGIALAFVLSTYAQVSFYLWHTGKLLNKKLSDFFPFKKIMLILLLSISVIGLGRIVHLFFSEKYLLISGVLICCFTIAALVTYHLKKEKTFLN